MSDLAKLVIKRFPENRNMQLVSLRYAAEFRCSGCHTKSRAKLLAVVSEDWEKLLCQACYEKRLSETPPEAAEDVIPTAWLGSTVSVQEAEEDNTVGGVPCGDRSAEWEEFKAAMIEGDEVWGFASPSDSRQQPGGRAGYALVRNGAVVKCFVMQLN